MAFWKKRGPKQGKPAHDGIPALTEPKGSCCGCSACCSACPAGAIRMEPDEEGFLYPVIDGEKCIRCGRCLSVCAFKKAQREKGFL